MKLTYELAEEFSWNLLEELFKTFPEWKKQWDDLTVEKQWDIYTKLGRKLEIYVEVALDEG
jgi:hypothetical protein